MNLDQPTFVEAARQMILGVVGVAVLIGLTILFGCCYYQAVGRVDWTQLMR